MANPPALILLETTEDEIKQKNITEFYKNEETKKQIITKLQKNGILNDYKVQIITKTGTELVVNVNANPIYNSQGKILAIHTTFIDQSSIAETRRSLRDSEQRNRALVEHAPEAITVLDMETMTFVDVNQKAMELFKMDRQELLSKSPIELTPKYLPDGKQSDIVALEKINEAIAGGKPIFDWIHIDSTGRKIPCQIQLIRLPHANRTLVRGSIIDMSEKIEAEQKLKRSQMELNQEKKMEAIGRLAGGIAHDFNNTLTVILGYCELLKLELYDNQVLYDMVSEIEQAGNKSSELVRQLLTFSRKEKPAKRAVDINLIIEETASLLQHLIGEDIIVEIDLDPNIGVIEAHPTDITQILMNLVINAREAMPHGGKLKIMTKDYMWMRGTGELHESVFLFISDTGIGMEDEIQDQIFEPFFTTKSSGTGLGLSTVYGLVEELNGSIKVESEAGQGTTFQLTFPVSDSEKVDQIVPENKFDETMLQGRHIIIVEDDAYVRNLVVKFAERFGMEVTATSSPTEVIELYKTTDYDIIISDMVMPEMSGVELVSHLRDSYPDLRVLIITGYMNQPQLQKVMAKGLPVLYKPFTQQNLLNMLLQIFTDIP